MIINVNSKGFKGYNNRVFCVYRPKILSKRIILVMTPSRKYLLQEDERGSRKILPEYNLRDCYVS